jgi:uncharacterized protein (DUF58 family)
VIPTVRLALLFAGGLVFAIGLAVERLFETEGLFTGPLIAWNAAIAALALLDLALVVKARISVRRTVPTVLSVGRQNAASLHLHSHLRRTAVVEVNDDGAEFVHVEGLPAQMKLSAGIRAVWRYHLRPTKRGAHELGDVWVRVASPFGLWKRQLRIPAKQVVRVYPDLQAVRMYEKLVREARDERFTRTTRRRGGESEFERLREYTRDDDVRRIDWRATARRRTVIAREYQLERNQNVMFLLDLGRLMTAETDGLSHLDHALNATLMLSHVSVRAGDHVGLAAFDHGLRTYISPEGGTQILKKFVRATYDLFPSLVEPDYRAVFSSVKSRLRKRSLVILFTQVLDPATQKQLLPLIRSLSPTHLPLCVVFRDQTVESLLRPDGESVVDLHTQGAAAAEVLWRERLVEEMRRAGAFVLHVHPQELTQQLIGRYLEIKGRQLL